MLSQIDQRSSGMFHHFLTRTTEAANVQSTQPVVFTGGKPFESSSESIIESITVKITIHGDSK